MIPITCFSYLRMGCWSFAVCVWPLWGMTEQSSDFFEKLQLRVHANEMTLSGMEGNRNPFFISPVSYSSLSCCRVISKGQTSSWILAMALQYPMPISAPWRMASGTCTRVLESSRWQRLQRTAWAQTLLSCSCMWSVSTSTCQVPWGKIWPHWKFLQLQWGLKINANPHTRAAHALLKAWASRHSSKLLNTFYWMKGKGRFFSLTHLYLQLSELQRKVRKCWLGFLKGSETKQHKKPSTNVYFQYMSHSKRIRLNY